MTEPGNDAAKGEEEEAERLRDEQVRRFLRERRQEDVADDESEAAQHGRRAERASYLADKLAERADADRRA